MPSIYPPYLEPCLDSLTRAARERVLVVDNSVTNIGTSAAWNQGVEQVLADRLDWLVILSAAMRFGPGGGAELFDALDAAPAGANWPGTDSPAWAAEALDAPHGVDGSGNIGAHAIAFPRIPTLETVGYFDTVFFAYMEMIDYGRRIPLAQGWSEGKPWPSWPKVYCPGCRVESLAHGLHLGGAKVDGGHMNDLYRAKWNGMKNEELWTRPYGYLPLTWIGPPPDSKVDGWMGWSR